MGIACSVCGKVTEFSVKESRYLHPNEAFLCSGECLLYSIVSRPAGKPVMKYKKSPVDDSRRVCGNPVWSPDYNIFFRSRYELITADFLTLNKIKFAFEEYEFVLSKGVYIPDFYLKGYDCFLEVKGRWGSGQKAKLSEFRILYPMVTLFVVSWLVRTKLLSSLRKAHPSKLRYDSGFRGRK